MKEIAAWLVVIWPGARSSSEVAFRWDRVNPLPGWMKTKDEKEEMELRRSAERVRETSTKIKERLPAGARRNKRRFMKLAKICPRRPLSPLTFFWGGKELRRSMLYGVFGAYCARRRKNRQEHIGTLSDSAPLPKICYRP